MRSVSRETLRSQCGAFHVKRPGAATGGEGGRHGELGRRSVSRETVGAEGRFATTVVGSATRVVGSAARVVGSAARVVGSAAPVVAAGGWIVGCAGCSGCSAMQAV